VDNPENTGGGPAVGLDEAAQLQVDESKTTAHYANFCRLAGTPEELLMEFGLNHEQTTESIVVTQRIATGWHTAKRLLQVLQLSVERYEAAFGVLETDVQKRVRPG
jgi:hypothetical protein